MHGLRPCRGQAAGRAADAHAVSLCLLLVFIGATRGTAASPLSRRSDQGQLESGHLRVEVVPDGSTHSELSEGEPHPHRQQMRKERLPVLDVVDMSSIVGVNGTANHSAEAAAPCPNDKLVPQADDLGEEDPFVTGHNATKKHHSALGGRRRFTPYEGNLSSAQDGLVMKADNHTYYHQYYYDLLPEHGHGHAGHPVEEHTAPGAGCLPLLQELLEEVHADLMRKHQAGLATPHEQAALEQFASDTSIGKFGAMQDMVNLQTLGDVLETGMDRLITITEIKELNTCLRLSPGEKWAGEENEPSGVPYMATTQGYCDLVEGDIALCARPTDAANASFAEQVSGGIWNSELWAEGMVRYCFDPHISPRAQAAVKLALAHISSQVPCITFMQVDVSPMVHENCAENPAVYIKSEGPEGDGMCWSMLGKVATDHVSQLLNLGPGCEFKGIAIHQLAHTLGMLHEQVRPDRDNYFRVWEGNVTSEQTYSSNFAVKPQVDTATTTYDMLSLMHFGVFAFSRDGRSLTFEPEDLRLVRFIGQRLGFSELDVRRLGHMYGCEDAVVPANRNAALSDLLLHGKALASGPGCADQTPTDIEIEGHHAQCREVKHMCSNKEVGAEISSQCPVTCFRCIPCLPSIAHNCNETGDETLKSEIDSVEAVHGTGIASANASAATTTSTTALAKTNASEEAANTTTEEATTASAANTTTSTVPGVLRDAGAADGRKGWGLQPIASSEREGSSTAQPSDAPIVEAEATTSSQSGADHHNGASAQGASPHAVHALLSIAVAARLASMWC